MGLRLPMYAGLDVNAVQAHDYFVKSGDMKVGLLAIGFLELFSGAALFELSKGSDRKPGAYGFDPLVSPSL